MKKRKKTNFSLGGHVFLPLSTATALPAPRFPFCPSYGPTKQTSQRNKQANEINERNKTNKNKNAV